MVLCVCDFSGYFHSQLILHLSDDFDCGDWLLFEVRTRYGQRTALLIRGTDPSSSSWIREGSGSSQSELYGHCHACALDVTYFHRYSPGTEFSLLTSRKRGLCEPGCSHRGS